MTRAAGMPRIFTALKPCQSAKSYTTLDLLVNAIQRGRKGTLGLRQLGVDGNAATSTLDQIPR